MRLLFLLPDGFPTFRSDVAVLFGKRLPELGVTVELVTHAEDAPATVAWQGGPVHTYRVGKSGIKRQLSGFMADLRALWRLDPDAIDAIQVRDKVFAAVVALWFARWHRKPLLYWMSFPMSERYLLEAREGGRALGLRWPYLFLKGWLGAKLLYRVVLPGCRHVFSQSERMSADLVARGLAASHVTAVPMGVDGERPVPALNHSKRDPRLQGRRVVVYLGTLDRARRLEFLIEAFAAVCRSRPDLMLLMVGDGLDPSDKARLVAAAEALGVAERIVWTGWVTSEEAWRWAAMGDLAVSLFPRGEILDSASPTKVVEYLALGLPVLANDQPDQAQVLRDSGAGLAVPMAATEFADGMGRLLDDEHLRRVMGQAGPAYVQGHREYRAIAQVVADTYRRLFLS